MKWWWVDGIIVLLLGVISGVWLTWHHAYGAYGDDSPGYIYTAHQLINGEALVQQDALVQDALAWFSYEPWARFVAPAHHEIISPEGWIASRYPIGLSVLMAGAAWLAGDPLAMYLVVPWLAVVVVLATYLGAVWLLPVSAPWKRVLGIGSAFVVLGSTLFFTYSVAQPMREIPALAFFLVAAFLTIKTKRWYWLVIAGMAFGYSVAIRETNAILLIPLLLYGLRGKWIAFGVGAILIYLPFLWYAGQITQHKEVFREKDITSIAITSNIDHIRSFQLSNLWDNQGKFKPGVGGINQYWSVIRQFSPWPPFLLCILIGLIYLWKHHRPLFRLLVSWTAVVIVLFAAWINPYPRYILPILPVLAWLSMLGALTSWQWLRCQLRLQRWASLAVIGLLAVSFIAIYQPVFANRQEYVRTGLPQDRELTNEDLVTIQAATDLILTHSVSAGQPPILLMLGETKGGLAETIMSHTNVRVIRFPNKDKEQPPEDQWLDYVRHLDETYALYLWYDPSVTVDEQRFYNQSVLTPVTTFATSFKPEIALYALTPAN